MTNQTHRRRRRHSSVCNRHPTSKPTAGLCATCLRERLSTIQSLSSDQVPKLRRPPSVRASRRILEEEETEDGGGEKKTMKEFIDLESRTHQTKKNVVTRTLKKLSLKLPKNVNNQEETGLGRSSCDVDLGRVSLEEARASGDGCLTGKAYPRLSPLSAVTEDAKAEEEKDPGGTAQTSDYYLDSRRTRSFDRSTRHGLLEVDELKAKFSPESFGLFHGAKLLVTERDSDWYSIEQESLALASKSVPCVAAGDVKKTVKKWPKGWNLWGLIHRKADAGKKEVKTDVMEGPFVESLLKLRRVVKEESNVSEKLMRSYSVSSRKSCDGMFHGTSIVNGLEGGRNSCDGLFHGSVAGVVTGRRRRRRSSSCEDGLFHGIEGKRNHLLQGDARIESYSPDNLRNRMVRFYLTPLKSQT